MVVNGVGTIGLVTMKNTLNSLCWVAPALLNTSLHRLYQFTESSSSVLNVISTCNEGEILCKNTELNETRDQVY